MNDSGLLHLVTYDESMLQGISPDPIISLSDMMQGEMLMDHIILQLADTVHDIRCHESTILQSDDPMQDIL